MRDWLRGVGIAASAVFLLLASGAAVSAAPAVLLPGLDARAQRQLAERMALEVAGCGGYYSLLVTASLVASDEAGLGAALRHEEQTEVLGRRFDPRHGYGRRLAAREFLFRAIDGEFGRMGELESTFPGHCARLLAEPERVLEELAQSLGLQVRTAEAEIGQP
jgi:hypothetical protein